METTIQTDSSHSFLDRRTGLIVFGIFTVLIGLLCALFVPLMLYGQAMSAKSGAPQTTNAILPAVVMYGLLAIVLVWLGVGSMLARRWARALLLIFSWSWLLMGLVSVATMAVMWSQLTELINSNAQANQLPAALIMLIPMIILVIIFIVTPGVWLLFYRSRHVKSTCEARDPVVRWTDRCPLPVLAICVWLALATPMMLLLAFSYNSVIPAFGSFVVGPAGSALYLLFAALWAYSAWSLYKLQWRGWWIIVTSITIFSVSAFITYSRHDVSELYSLMGYPEEQIAQIQKFSFAKGKTMAWFSLCGTVPFIGYLLYLRKFLRPS
jgi:hypothetical protein